MSRFALGLWTLIGLWLLVHGPLPSRPVVYMTIFGLACLLFDIAEGYRAHRCAVTRNEIV